jgi:predicted RND superfamily exporter protein
VEHEREWKRFSALYPMQNMNPIVYLVDTEKEARRLVERINEMRSVWSRYRDDQGRALVKGAFSALTFVPEHQQEKYTILKEIQAFLQKRDIEDWVQGKVKDTYKRYKEMLRAKPYSALDLPDYVRNDLVLLDPHQRSRVRGYLVVVQSDADYSHGKMVIQVDALLKSLRVDGRVYLPSGEPIIAGELMRLINLDSLIAILASFLTSFLLVWLDLRNLRLALMSLWPLLSGMLGMALVLVVFDVRLNIFNMVVLPSLLGIGIDAGVHLLHRYRERVSLGIRGVLHELRGVIVVASVTTLVSFASMFFADHRGIRSVGEVAVIGLFACFFGSLVFLPALMQVLFDRYPLTEEELLSEKNEP